MPVSIDDIAKQMLALLPDDGTPVLNRVMRVMLSRALATRVDQDQYFEARDLDPQASASICFAGGPLLYTLIKDGRTFDSFFED